MIAVIAATKGRVFAQLTKNDVTSKSTCAIGFRSRATISIGVEREVLLGLI